LKIAAANHQRYALPSGRVPLLSTGCRDVLL
jgi:hypothetical protein